MYINFFLFRPTLYSILNKKKRSKEYFLQTLNSFNCVNVSVIALLLFVTNGFVIWIPSILESLAFSHTNVHNKNQSSIL